MSNFSDEQGRTKVFAEAYLVVRRRQETCGERRSSVKGPFMNGNWRRLPRLAPGKSPRHWWGPARG
jgi:hypothetical protein